jgi:hypothetical protein
LIDEIIAEKKWERTFGESEDILEKLADEAVCRTCTKQGPGHWILISYDISYHRTVPQGSGSTAEGNPKQAKKA